METLLVLAALAGVGARAELVHGQCKGLVGLLAQGAKRHGSRHEMLDDGLHGLHFGQVNGTACGSLEVEEVADEDGLVFLIGHVGVFLEQLVVAAAGGQLQCGDGVGVPGVAYAVAPPVELAERGQGLLHVRLAVAGLLHAERLVVKGNGVVGDGLQADTSDGTVVGAEIGLQQRLRQADGLENLGAAVAADG